MTSIRAAPQVHFPDDGSRVLFSMGRIPSSVQSEDPGFRRSLTNNHTSVHTTLGMPNYGQHAYKREDVYAQRAGHGDFIRSCADDHDVTHNPSATTNDSPSGCYAPLVHNTSLPPSLSPSPDVKPAPLPDSDLSPLLQCFEQTWNVREIRPTLLASGEWRNAFAFLSQRKTCTIYFRAGDEPWDVSVGPRADSEPLTVMDVIMAIDAELYRELDPVDMYASHPRYQDAVNERLSRYWGQRDATVNTFRNIDLYPDREPYFLGLVEEVDPDGEIQYFVQMGAALNV